MNNPREQIEARITALLLGELPEAEAELLRWTIAQDADLQKLHDELKSTIVLVRETVKPRAGSLPEAGAPLKLSDQRRAQLLAHFKTARPTPVFWLRPIVNVPRLVTAFALLALVGVLAAMLLPALSKAKMRSRGAYGGTESLAFRTWSGDDSKRQELKSAPQSGVISAGSSAERSIARPASFGRTPTTVTVAPEPVLAAPPPKIVLPADTSEVTTVTTPSAGPVGGGVYSQHIVGYVNAPLVANTTPLSAEASMPPAASIPNETPSPNVHPGNIAGVIEERRLPGAETAAGEDALYEKRLIEAQRKRGQNAVDNGKATDASGIGHGEHVAGIIGSSSYKDSNGTVITGGLRGYYDDHLRTNNSMTLAWDSNGGHAREGIPTPPLSSAVERNVFNYRLNGVNDSFAMATNSVSLGLGDIGSVNNWDRELIVTQPPAAPDAVASTETISASEALSRYAKLSGRTPLTSGLVSGNVVLDKIPSQSKEAAIKQLELGLAKNDVALVNIGGAFVKPVPADQAGSAGQAIARNRRYRLDDDPNVAGPSPTLDSQQLQIINQQMFDDTKLYKGKLAELRELQSIQATNKEKLNDVLPMIVQDSDLGDLVGKLNEAKQKYVALNQDYSAANSNIAPLQAQIDELHLKIDDRVGGIMEGLAHQVNVKKAEIDALTQRVEEAKQRDQVEAVRTQPYYAAKLDLEQKRRLHELLYSKLEAEKIDFSLPKNSMVQLTDPAEPNTNQTFWQRLKGQYESTARMKVENDVSDIATMSGGTPSAPYDPYFVNTTAEIMRSDPVLSNVVNGLQLDETWAKHGNRLTKKEAIAMLKSRVDVRPVKNTKLIEIGVTSADPKEAAQLANAVAEAYKNYRFDTLRATTTNGLAAMDEQFQQQEEAIQRAQERVERLRQQIAITDLGPEPMSTDSNVTQMVQLKYVKPTEMAQVLGPSAQSNSIVASDGDGTLVLRGKAEDINRMRELIAQVDVSVPAEYISDVIPIRYAKADDIADALNLLSEDAANKGKLPLHAQVRIIADARSSSLLVYATREDMDVLKGAVAKLDTKQADLPVRKPAPNAPIPQPEILTHENAFSTFSLNVSDVSFKLAAASLEKGQMPEAAAIRSEEFINAFDYRDPVAAPGQPLAFAAERARYPFAQNRDLLRFSLKTAATGRQAGRPLNLVLLLDTSGSMERADRVAIVREALRVLAAQLQPTDTVSVVTFARTARLWADGVSGDKAGETLDKVGSITPEGGTNLEEAMRLAYETARRHYLANGINRVVLLTDGAANLGKVEPAALKQTVEAQRRQGVALDCFGIGWEDFNDDLLAQLSGNGDGRYAFINSPEDAGTEFAAKLAGALQVAAQDVKVQVEFNPQRVTSWRQIGYATHQLTKEQFRDNSVIAAEIAAQEAGNALYTVETNPNGEGPVATVRVRYKVPGTAEVQEHSFEVSYSGVAPALAEAGPAMRLAATASAFSEWLVASPFAQEVSPDELLKMISGVPQVYGADQRPAKLETMIREAKSIAGK